MGPLKCQPIVIGREVDNARLTELEIYCLAQAMHCSGRGRIASDGPRGIVIHIRTLRVQEVEQHDVFNGRIGQPGALLDKITDGASDVAQAWLPCLAAHYLDHPRLSIEAVHGPRASRAAGIVNVP